MVLMTQYCEVLRKWVKSGQQSLTIQR